MHAISPAIYHTVTRLLYISFYHARPWRLTEQLHIFLLSNMSHVGPAKTNADNVHVVRPKPAREDDTDIRENKNRGCPTSKKVIQFVRGRRKKENGRECVSRAGLCAAKTVGRWTKREEDIRRRGQAGNRPGSETRSIRDRCRSDPGCWSASRSPSPGISAPTCWGSCSS